MVPRCPAVFREEYLHSLHSCTELLPTPTYPFLDRRRAAAVTWVRSPAVRSGDHLIRTAFADEAIFLGWMEDWLPLLGFQQYTTHSVTLIFLWIYSFILIILLFWRMAEHRGKCYIPESCPCTWKDREFLSGEVIATPCYTWWVHFAYFQITWI